MGWGWEEEAPYEFSKLNVNLSSLHGKEPNTKGTLLGVVSQIRQIRDNISREKKVQMTVGEEKTELRNDQGMKVSFYENIRKGSSEARKSILHTPVSLKYRIAYLKVCHEKNYNSM